MTTEELDTNMVKEQVWFVYILLCDDNSLYTGITTDIARRVKEHNSSKKAAKYTRARRPVTLTYHEVATSRSAATKRECQIKKMPLSAKKTLIKGHPTAD